MEKRKLLLVAISVGIFLVIVIGASILVLSPKKDGTETARPIPAGASGFQALPSPEAAPYEAGQPAMVDAADMVRNREGLPGLETPPSHTMAQENNFYVNTDPSRNPGPEKAVPSQEGSPLTINVPRPYSAAVPDTPPVGRAAPQETSPGSQPSSEKIASSGESAAQEPAVKTPAPAKPSVAIAPRPTPRPVTPTAKPSPVSAPPAAKPPAPPATARAAPSRPPAEPVPPRTQEDYWVQTGSFSAQTRAEGVRETLASKGITSIIENRDVDGKTYFRVRVGPYTSQNEANYWLALIKSINGFEDSQVWKTRR
jgi:DedD protein